MVNIVLLILVSICNLEILVNIVDRHYSASLSGIFRFCVVFFSFEGSKYIWRGPTFICVIYSCTFWKIHLGFFSFSPRLNKNNNAHIYFVFLVSCRIHLCRNWKRKAKYPVLDSQDANLGIEVMVWETRLERINIHGVSAMHNFCSRAHFTYLMSLL